MSRKVFSKKVNLRKAVRDIKDVENWGRIENIKILVLEYDFSGYDKDAIAAGIVIYMKVNEGKPAPMEYGTSLMSFSPKEISLFLKNSKMPREEALISLSAALDCFASRLKKKLERKIGRKIDGYLSEKGNGKKSDQNNHFGPIVLKGTKLCCSRA